MTSSTERMKEHVAARPSRPVQSPYRCLSTSEVMNGFAAANS